MSNRSSSTHKLCWRESQNLLQTESRQNLAQSQTDPEAWSMWFYLGRNRTQIFKWNFFNLIQKEEVGRPFLPPTSTNAHKVYLTHDLGQKEAALSKEKRKKKGKLPFSHTRLHPIDTKMDSRGSGALKIVS